MVKRRSRFMPGFQSRFMPARPLPSTRSSVRATTYGPSYSRRSLDDDALYLPYRASVLPHYSYDTSGSDYATQSDINRELIMSSAAMEDNYDITARSRQKDKDVLAAANRAIVDTEVHSTAKGAVAALRVARGHSTPPANLSRTEAALLANKVEVNLPARKRHPKSSYAQARLRQMRRDKPRDDGDVETVVVADSTSGLKAHPPVYDPSIGKPYWDVEGVRKPNLMSWKYRLDTYASPDDLIIVPRSLTAVRSQLREAHNKLDHHKQLVDRYLVADKGFSVEDSIALAASKAHLGERA